MSRRRPRKISKKERIRQDRIWQWGDELDSYFSRRNRHIVIYRDEKFIGRFTLVDKRKT